MRTTLDLDADVLQAAKELAVLRKTTAGKVLSELARKALEAPKGGRTVRNGVPVLPRRSGGRRVTMEDVNKIRDES